MKEYIVDNKKTYETVYKAGWGNLWPDSTWISIYYNIIKPITNIEGGGLFWTLAAA